MNKEQYPYCTNNLRKWLLVVTVILNVYTFSGYTANSQSKIQTFQTELAVNYSQVGEKAIDYVKYIETSRTAGVILATKKSWKHALFAYSTAKKVEFESLSYRSSSINTNHFFHPIKTISQDSDEDSFVPKLG